MDKLAARVRRWWTTARHSFPAETPFAVTCECGQVCAGVRRAHAQTMPCPACGAKLFVLPLSQLPPVKPPDLPDRGPRTSRSGIGRSDLWRRPLTAAGLTLALVIVVFLVILVGTNGRHLNSGPTESAAVLFERGQRALAEGKVRLASESLVAAQAAAERLPWSLNHAERRQLTQLHRQAALLSDLLAEPLEDVLANAVALNELDEREWQMQFAERYRGKAVVFEDEVRRDPGGECQLLGYRLFARGQPVRLDVSELRLFRALPLDRPQRLLFGARLADVRIEPGGVWAVHFDPDSAVLLTDPGAAAAYTPLPPRELQELIQRQAAWVAEMP